MWFSAAGAHLLQGSMCCAFRDGILHVLVVTSVYLSYCFLSIISNQSVHYPLTSTKHFRPHNCRSLDIFYCDCDLICNFFLKLFIFFIIQQRQAINHSMQCWAHYLKSNVILLATSHKY